MKSALFCALLLLPPLLALEIQPLHEFGNGPLPASVTAGGVRPSETDDPVGRHGRVLRTDWPVWRKGAPEWPALRFSQGSFPVADWQGWDHLRVAVLNPSEEVVDLGICVRGNGKSINTHHDLQPNVWNYVLLPVATIRSQLQDASRIASFDLFMTRPGKAFVLYVKRIDLVRAAPPGETSIPLVNVFGGFESPEDAAAWDGNGIRTERIRERAGEGEWALRVVYPQHAAGNPPWPALQAWAGQGAMPEDWSFYRRLAFRIGNPGGEASIKLCLRDGDKRKYTRVFPLGEKADVDCTVELRETGLKLTAMRQFDLFLTRPDAEQALVVDNVRLVADPAAEAATALAGCAAFRASLAELPAGERAPFEAALERHAARLRELVAACQGPTVPPAELHAFPRAPSDSGRVAGGCRARGTLRPLPRRRRPAGSRHPVRRGAGRFHDQGHDPGHAPRRRADRRPGRAGTGRERVREPASRRARRRETSARRDRRRRRTARTGGRPACQCGRDRSRRPCADQAAPLRSPLRGLVAGSDPGLPEKRERRARRGGVLLGPHPRSGGRPRGRLFGHDHRLGRGRTLPDGAPRGHGLRLRRSLARTAAHRHRLPRPYPAGLWQGSVRGGARAEGLPVPRPFRGLQDRPGPHLPRCQRHPREGESLPR